MNNKTFQQFRSLVVDLLDDNEGISQAAYDSLQAFEGEHYPGACTDIFRAASGSDGRVYLGETDAEAFRS
jgi:hypothetical protein